MNKTFKTIYSVLFFLVISLPLVLMPFFKNKENLEKRDLAKFPKYVEDGRLNQDFSTGFDTWLNDRVPFRAQLLSCSNFIKTEVFHTSTSNVIRGKEGWLFFENESPDYMNTNAMTDNEIKAFGVTLSLIEENVTSRGGRFVFAPIPNKSSVYGEKMPSCYTKAPENNLTRITKELDRINVSHADCLSVLVENKDKDLYHKRDSHWNYKGALMGYNRIMERLGAPHKTYDDAKFTKTLTWRGDLDKLLYPAGGFMDYQYDYDIKFSDFTFKRPKKVEDTTAQLKVFMGDGEMNDEYFITQNKSAQNNGTAYVVRDSFGRALLPFIIDNYKEATFRRTTAPDITAVPDGADMIYEIVERNLHRVTAKAPFMFAPQRKLDIAGLASGGDAKVFSSNEKYGARIYGMLPDGIETGDGRVCIILSDGGSSYCFEAFPIYEKELISETSGLNAPARANGFSAFINGKETPLSGTYDITVVTGGKTYQGSKITLSPAAS